MTKKDFALIARVLGRTRPARTAGESELLEELRKETWSQWAFVRNEFAAELKAENPRFDAERFKRACDA